MKKLFAIGLLGLFAAGCGDAGLAFNVAKEVGVDAPLEIPGAPVAGIPQPRTEQDVEFDLSEVTDDLDGLGELVLNGISYEITGVDPNEEVALDEISITANAGGSSIELINLTGTLQNRAKTPVTLSPADLDALENQLFNAKSLNATVVVDLVTFSGSDIQFVITTYYDVTLKIREDLL